MKIKKWRVFLPTHNTIVYAVASLVTLTLGSFFVCSHVHEKWLKQFNYSLMDANALIKGFIVCLGFVVISPSNLLGADPLERQKNNIIY